MQTITNYQMLKAIKFLQDSDLIEQDFRGHSSALRYICTRNTQKYFIKIYEGNRLENIEFVDSIYQKLRIPTAKIIEKNYLKEFNKTCVIYEYIEGKTLKELTKEVEVKKIEKIGYKVGSYLSKFEQITGDKEKLIKEYEIRFKELIDKLYDMKNYYESQENKPLPPICLAKMCAVFEQYKVYIYNTKPCFIHKDINFNNIIVKNNETYFIDNDGGRLSFRAFDFRGICWWTWEGENIEKEQAMYRGIYKGLFHGNIPDNFHKELAFTIIYEFLLKIEEVYKTHDMARMEYVFYKFLFIFEKTNYFENYKFEWFN